MRSGPVPLLALALVACAGHAPSRVAPVPDAQVPQRRELLHTSEFTVYLLDLGPGDSTPMHRHDRDIVTVFTSRGRTRSTFWGQPPRLDRPPFGAVRFRTRGFTHVVVNLDTARFQAVIVAFARSQGLPDTSAASRSPACAGGACDARVRDTTLFCVVDACIHDVTIEPQATWHTGPTATMLVYVTPATLSATDAADQTVRRTRMTSAVDVDSAGAFRAWHNDGTAPARLIAFLLPGTAKVGQ